MSHENYDFFFLIKPTHFFYRNVSDNIPDLSLTLGPLLGVGWR